VDDSSQIHLLGAVVELADARPDGDGDDVERMARLTSLCAGELAGVAGAGALWARPDGRLATAASPAHVEPVELLAMQRLQGPGVDAFRTGSRVAAVACAHAGDRWPDFAAAALDAGFASAASVPLRRRETVVGALTLYAASAPPIPEPAPTLARVLANATTVGILNGRALADARRLAGQLGTALTSRVPIEQAKGALALRFGTDADRAFVRLRDYARSHNALLHDVARDIMTGALDPGALAAGGDA
jgi:hypothetical protein